MKLFEHPDALASDLSSPGDLAIDIQATLDTMRYLEQSTFWDRVISRLTPMQRDVLRDELLRHSYQSERA